MSIAVIEMEAGAAGNMLLGALVDAGAPLAEIEAHLRRLPLEGWRFVTERVEKNGVEALWLDVEVEPGVDRPHRHFTTIRDMIRAAELPERVKADAIRVFERLGRAEATVHECSLEQVHFHEVGAIDAIVDIVGGCLGFHLLDVEEIYATPLVNGQGGTIHCDHGEIDNPAPATRELMAGFAQQTVPIPKELTTPTGAALITGLAKEIGYVPRLEVTSRGTGAGTMNLADRANILTILIGKVR